MPTIFSHPAVPIGLAIALGSANVSPTKKISAMPSENILLLAYFLTYFLMGFVVRSFLVYRRTGINPLVLPRTQDAYGYVGTAFKV
ncbi:MAG: hypothetical protein RLZZ573_1650, partial [Pseudomonadota bacterium]